LALVLGCYRAALALDLSGPIAVVTAGLCMASPSPRFGMSADARTVVTHFWSLLDQLLNAMLFLLIGLQLLGLVIRPSQLLPIVFAVPLAVTSRLISVAAPLALTRARLRDKMRDTAVLTWAGLRGGISIALALTLPEGAWRTELLVAVYAVVVFTIVMQGLTISRFLKWVYAADKPA
jgi:Na+:H+ antiporter